MSLSPEETSEWRVSGAIALSEFVGGDLWYTRGIVISCDDSMVPRDANGNLVFRELLVGETVAPLAFDTPMALLEPMAAMQIN